MLCPPPDRTSDSNTLNDILRSHVAQAAMHHREGAEEDLGEFKSPMLLDGAHSDGVSVDNVDIACFQNVSARQLFANESTGIGLPINTSETLPQAVTTPVHRPTRPDPMSSPRAKILAASFKKYEA